MTFDKKLKILLDRKGWTANQLAYKTDLKPCSIRLWLRGINKPRLSNLHDLCQVLGVSASVMIDDSKEL